MKLPFVISIFLLPFFAEITHALPVTLYAPFNAIGLRGNITFHQERPGSVVQISIHLTSSVVSDGVHQFSWSVYSNPVFYDAKGACNKVELGKVEHKLSDRHGPIQIPPSGNEMQTFSDSDISLQGVGTIWGRPLLLVNLNSSLSDQVACTNLFHSEADVKTAEAVFTRSVAGTVVFRENELGDTVIFSNLFHTGNGYQPASRHDWKILVTDILDTKRADKCNYLSNLFDPNYVGDKNCSKSDHMTCKMGDLSKKHGMVTVGSANNRYSKQFLVDTNLPLSIFTSSASSRSLYLVLYEKNSATRVMTCAQINGISQKEVKAELNMDGVKGFIRFSQRYRMDPTVVTVSLNNLMGRGKWYHIHEFPVPTQVAPGERKCSALSVGGHFNPFGVDFSKSPAPRVGTSDQYQVGDLSGKYGLLAENAEGVHFGIFVDFNLPLFGVNSVIGRSIVIHEASGNQWICSTIGYPEATVNAIATFVYPVVGQLIMRQSKDKPWSETSVFIDLSYSDGSVNNTDSHSWDIHLNPAARDFYNWSKRCESAGEHYNPFDVGVESGGYSKCSPENSLRCQVGDLALKSNKLSVAGFRGSKQTKLFYTDVLLPLSGPYSVVGRSVVIHDKSAPKQRGDRMACATITPLHPLMAGVRRWRVGAGITSNVSGSIIFYQETQFDRTNGKVDLHGLNSLAGGYHVHNVWVPRDKEFPCSGDSVYGHFNPLNVDVNVGPLPGVGTSDQYEVGDLSGKFGLLDNKAMERFEFTDPNLPLHGGNSIIGRSLVIHKKDKNFRWICGTIRPEAKKAEAREIVGIASFDNPRHLVAGFIRFKQFEYKDGSTSTTFMEVGLKYPGAQNRNVTLGHKWAVFVNQVGEDAFNSAESVKCLAAGYRWNPYLSASNSKLYERDCNHANPLRCEMGDLSGRHGPLVVGGKRLVASDINLPLTGNFSIMERSIVIFGKNGSEFKLACANIKPDIHLVSNIAVKRHPSFTVAKFMDHMRSLLVTTDWLVSADLEQSKHIIDGECIQMSIHFYGFNAHRLQKDFSNLINLGSLMRTDRFSSKTISTFYKPCRSLHELNGDPNSSCGRQLSIFCLILIAFQSHFQ